MNVDEPQGSALSGTMIDLNRNHNIVDVPVKAIDHCNACRDATFIKMDVEGSEYEALLGAQETIKRNRPKLVLYQN